MPLVRRSPCKVNLLLNILGRRPDGFHELETLFFPVPLEDELRFARGGDGVVLTCSHPDLPLDSGNLVHRAATRFLERAGLREGVRIHLEKHVPLAAGLGGGSGNAAQTLLGLNELFGTPLEPGTLDELAAGLGSDVNFFLQPNPALAWGRGERIEPLESFACLHGCALLLYHPGFGISTAWAYKELARFPDALAGRPGRARELAARLVAGDRDGAMGLLYNSLEAPALEKHPVLALYQETFRDLGAMGTLMSGSGSTTFAFFPDRKTADAAVAPFEAAYGTAGWLRVVGL
ncbi:MAG: 4-(cytidine 5'-diphospho)-2-C-methyl-D-erythritol kinase [Verrucomicrobia bacterium]|nr:MAG: 4-(cytidine 5'-diphospho)-2-C-methyl-D-erythritol kinase [Verrucomicrobiota bacterium]